jgi:hypothetical protein
MTRSISFSRPMTGSSLPSRAPGEITAALVQHEGRQPRELRSSTWRNGLLVPDAVQHLDDLPAGPVQVGAQRYQNPSSHPVALTDQREQEVLGADVVVAQLQRLAQRQLQHLLGLLRERDVAGRRLLALADDIVDRLPHGIEAYPQRFEGSTPTPWPTLIKPSSMCSVPI